MNENHGGGFGVGGPNPAGKYFIGNSYLKPLSKIDDINFYFNTIFLSIFYFIKNRLRNYF